MRKQRFGGAGFHQLAVLHDGDLVRQILDYAEIVGDEEIGDPEFLLQLLQQIEDLGLDGDIERRGRLIGDDQLGLYRQRTRDRQTLSLPAGKFVRIAGEGVAPQADFFQQRCDALGALCRRDIGTQ